MTPDPLAGALATLGQAFTVAQERQPGAGRPRRRTWLDTFDWRLHRAGLALEREQGGRGTRLILTRPGGNVVAEQPVTSTGARPVRLADIPPGPVRDAVMSLIGVRALIPLATVTTTRTVYRLQNQDGKTVARLMADHTAGLPVSLWIAPLRGYPGQARRAAAMLAEAVGDGLRVGAADGIPVPLDRRPAGYSAKIDAPIDAAMPAPRAVAVIMLRLLDMLEQNLDGTLRDIDTEFLHELRVAVRRTRSAIKLLGDQLPDDLRTRYQAEFKWLGDLTTPVRDLDVHLLGFDGLAATLTAASPGDLEPFRAFLLRRRVRELRRLTAGLRSERFRTLTQDWRKALTEVRDSPRPARRSAAQGSAPSLTAAQLAAERTGAATAKLLKRGRAITAQSPPESLHDLRKRGKELRYLLEFFAPLQDRGPLVSALKRLQDCLGEFQDSQVQREEISAFAGAMLAERTGADAGRHALVTTLLAMGEISADLARRQREAREEFARLFARFERSARA